MNIEDRIKYYIGKLKTQKWDINFDTKTEYCYYTDICGEAKIYQDIFPLNYGIYLINDSFTSELYREIMLKKHKKIDFLYTVSVYIDYNINGYIDPIIKLYKSDEYFYGKIFLIRPSDVYYNMPIPIITKTRPVGDSYNVIINLDNERHWADVNKIPEIDIPFKDKDNKIIWRGASNGFVYSTERPSRLTLCKKYFGHVNPMIDIAFSSNSLLDENKGLYLKSGMTIQDQLKSKFLVSVEGGDVATSLKWMLYSNSTVLMSKPTIVSWAMEDMLEPWVHYVPLEKDFDDLEEKYNWCLNNLDKCEEISNNGKKYIEQFLDEEREKLITNLVLREYVDNMKITKM
jgi:hypothetical protein